MNKNQTLTIYTDGASRGNPGPAAAAFIARVGDETIHQQANYLQHTTNNVAEYQAVLLALQWLQTYHQQNPVGDCHFFLDSQLVQRQLIGQYKIKQPHLQTLHQQIQTIRKQLQTQNLTTNFTHIPRNQNNLADGLANQCLDQQS